MQAMNVHGFSILIHFKNKHYPAQCVEKPSATAHKSRNKLCKAVYKADLTTLSETCAFHVGVNPKPWFCQTSR